MHGTQRNRKWLTSARRDLLLLLALGGVLFFLASLLDAFEAIVVYIHKHEAYELDEVITVMILGSVGLAVFAYRRWQEVRTEMAKRIEAEQAQRAMEIGRLHGQRLESLGTLAGGVAYEINNPTMGVMNYAQLILDGSEPGSHAAEFATEIIAESKRITSTVKALLEFARAGPVLSERATPVSIVTPIGKLFEAITHRDNIALAIDVPSDLPPIRCRSQEIQQVLLNLLTNARDALNERYPSHDPDKKVTLSVRSLQHDGATQIRFTVEDRGPGVDPEVAVRIFDPFFTTKDRSRGGGSTPKGTGLGLSISHRIAQDHGGALSVDSTLGEFTRFHLDLPVEGNPRGEQEDGP
jgi:signal transduction histidine kinase